MAKEVIDFWRCKKDKGFVIKFDIEKTFDKINWSFIDFILMKNAYSTK